MYLPCENIGKINSCSVVVNHSGLWSRRRWFESALEYVREKKNILTHFLKKNVFGFCILSVYNILDFVSTTLHSLPP